MVICGGYMFESKVNKDMQKEKEKTNDKRGIPTYLLTLIVKELKISVRI
jgi:hypothetical protein